MSHPVVKQLEVLNPPDGSLVIFRVQPDAKKAFMAGTAQSIGKWIEQTQRFHTCVLLLSPDANVEEMHPRSVLEILERQPKENVEKVMEAWRIAHAIAPDDPMLVGLYALQQQMSKVIDAAMEMKAHVEEVANDEGRSWPFGEKAYTIDGKLPFDVELEALRNMVAEAPPQHLAPDAPAPETPTEAAPMQMPESCAACNAPNFARGAAYECRNGHGPADQMRAARLKQLEAEEASQDA